MAGSGGEADERQGRGRREEDRPADLGAERLAVEDHVAAIAFDADLVGFLDMDAGELGAAEPPARLAKKARAASPAAARPRGT